MKVIIYLIKLVMRVFAVGFVLGIIWSVFYLAQIELTPWLVLALVLWWDLEHFLDHQQKGKNDV